MPLWVLILNLYQINSKSAQGTLRLAMLIDLR